MDKEVPVRRVDVGTILGRTGNLIAGDMTTALVMLVLFTVLGTLSDFARTNANTVINIGTVAAEYFVIRRLCQSRGLIGEQEAGGFWGFFGVGLLSGVGITLGVLLLVIPGIYLAARWSVASVVLIAERRTVTDALGESWRHTADHVIPIGIAIIIVFVPAILGVGIAFALGDDAGNLSLFASLLSNVALFCSVVAGWYLGVAIYSLLARDDTTLSRIFE